MEIWIPISSAFTVGFAFGWVFERYIIKRTSWNIRLRSLVSAVIFGLWTASMVIDMINGTTNTPFMLHAFMGAVIGAVNKEFGEFLLKFIKK